MSRLLLALALLPLLASCAISGRRPSMEAPRPARHLYHHRQREHERERRHHPHTAWQTR